MPTLDLRKHINFDLIVDVLRGLLRWYGHVLRKGDEI